MGTCPQLTEYEKGQISSFKSTGKSINKISKLLNCSRQCIRNYLSDPSNYGKNFTSHHPSKLTEREISRVYRMASEGNASAKQIIDSLKLNVSMWTVRRLLNSSDIFRYMLMNKIPKLTKVHEENRLLWAKMMDDYGEENWSKIIFFDEKKWNLDGPDGLWYYWHDLRFWWDGKTNIAFLEGCQSTDAYIYTMPEYLLPVAHRRFGLDYVFQQDNASIHSSYGTSECFQEENIRKMDWPAKLQDLNPIENIWGYLTRKVYRGGRQFQAKDELKSAIIHEWNNFEPSYLKRLVLSMKIDVFK